MEQMKKMMEQVLNRLDAIEEQVRLNNADIYTTEDLAKVLGVSKVEIYKLTAKKMIPFHKPTNGRLFFKRKEINRWVSLNDKENG